MQCSAGGEESIGRERQFGLAACRAGGHGKQRAGRSRRRAGSHIRSAARPRTAWWQFDWRHGLCVCVCVCVCGRGAREVGGVLGTRAGMTGCSCDMLQVTSAYACDKEDGRGGHIWTHSWLMQLRVWPSTHTHTHTHTESWNKRHKRESLHLSSPNFDAWWDWVSYANNRFKSNGSALPSQK